MTTAVQPKKPPKLFDIRGDATGAIVLTLSKSAAFSIAKTRDIFFALSRGAPTVAGQAKGIAEAIDRFMSDVASGKPGPEQDDVE